MIRYISIYDLMQDDYAASVVRSGDEAKLKTLLWTIGFDTSKDIERQEVYHRPLSRKDQSPIFGMRLVGTERSDQAWKTSGNWSLDARLEHYRENDPEFYKDLVSMSYQHNFTGEIVDHIKTKGSTISRKTTTEDIEGKEESNE